MMHRQYTPFQQGAATRPLVCLFFGNRCTTKEEWGLEGGSVVNCLHRTFINNTLVAVSVCNG